MIALRPKAADLSDVDVLIAVIGRGADRSLGACGWDVAEEFPNTPEKVVLAKLRRLGKRKIIDGCPCGCRGDWTLTELGLQMLSDACLDVRDRKQRWTIDAIRKLKEARNG